jgi:hypothetical protein
MDSAKLAILFFSVKCGHLWNQVWPNKKKKNGRKEYRIFFTAV